MGMQFADSHPYRNYFIENAPVVGPSTASYNIGDVIDLNLTSNLQDANFTVYNLPSDLNLSVSNSVSVQKFHQWVLPEYGIMVWMRIIHLLQWRMV